MSLLDVLTGGKSGNATDAEKAALAAMSGVQTPTTAQLSLPELQQYAVSQNMSPAQMQAFLQANNALSTENTDQTGTAAQKAALSQLAGVANQGAAGNATEQAQQSQIQQDMGRTLAGQRGAIDQQAQARGVAPGLLQAALSQQNAGQDLQNANQAALAAQSGNYQTALNAMAQGGNLGQGLQGQQNTQANTVAGAQNAMQQFNAANQQSAAASNQNAQQQANQYNTGMANQVGQQNTGLANERTKYNAQVPETVFNNQMQKATGVAGANQNMAQNDTNQGNQLMGIYGAGLGAAGDFAAPASTLVKGAAHGGMIESCCPGMSQGGMCMVHGGKVPGKAPLPGDHRANDIVPARLSPGEAVIPRSTVQQNPNIVHQLLAQSQQQDAGHHPADVAALLQAMKHLRGQSNAPQAR